MVVPVSVHIAVTGLKPDRSVQPGGLRVNALESSFYGIAVFMTHPAEQCDRWVESLLKDFQEK